MNTGFSIFAKSVLESFIQYLKKGHALSKEAEAALRAILRINVLKRNTELQPIGKACKTIYFIKKGLARIYYYKDDIEITENFSFENSLVVRFESLITGRASRKAIQVIEDSEIISLDAGKFFELFHRFPELETHYRLMLESALLETINRIENIQFHTAEERYNDLISQAPNVLKRVPLKFIASYLGITPVSLSRIRAMH